MLPVTPKGGDTRPVIVRNRIRNGLLLEIEVEASRRQSEALVLFCLKQNLSALALDHPLWLRADAAWAAWCEVTERAAWEPDSRAWEGPRQLLMTYGQRGETGDPLEFLKLFSEAVEASVHVWPRAAPSSAFP